MGFKSLFKVFLRSGFARQKPQMPGANTRKIEHLVRICLSPLGATRQMWDFGQKHRRNGDFEQALSAVHGFE